MHRRAADIDMACLLAIDSKTDYPAACNAVEKILVHANLADDGRLYKLQVRAPLLSEPDSDAAPLLGTLPGL